MKRFVSIALLALAVAGCRSALTVTNRSDPKAFAPVDVPGAGATGTVYAELDFDVPDDISDEDFEITRADIFGVVSLDEVAVPGSFEVSVDIYVSTVPGQGSMTDPSTDEYLATVVLTDEASEARVEVNGPETLKRGISSGMFYVKILASINENPTGPSDPLLGVLNIRDIYFIATIERETGGLFPAFYVL